jgi:hypothetical protein
MNLFGTGFRVVLMLLGSGTKRNRGLKNHVCNVPFARYRKNDVIRTLYFPKNLWESGNRQGEKARSASMPQYPVSHLSNFSGVLL